MPEAFTENPSPRQPQEETWQTVKGLVVGQKLFSRYSLEKVLGRGGMGIVWLARDERLNRYVALKVLPDEFFYDQAARDDLKHETRKSLELTHPNIVRIHDFIEDDKGVALSMEFVDGQNLSELRLQQEKKLLDADALAPWLACVCEALHYAHNTAKLVHRDLKPANIMISRRGHVKITDFGIACSLHNSLSRVSVRQSSSGTIVYMSPEQMMGGAPSPLDDIYSIGATIYEAMTSKPPFYAGDIASQVSRKDPVSMAERRRELDIEGKLIPKEWEKTVAKCLSKDPRQRPKNPMELMQMLGLSPSPSTGSPKTTFVSKPSALDAKKESHKTVVITTSSIALVGAIFIGRSLFFGPEITHSAPAPTAPVYAGVPTPSAAEGSQSAVVVPADNRASASAPAVLADKQYLAAAESTARLELATDPDGIHFKVFAGAQLAPVDSGTSGAIAAGAVPIREGVTPATLDNMPVGPLTVVFSRSGWNDQVREINLKSEGAKAEATFAIGKLNVTSKPAGAGILFDDKLVGIAPLILEVPPGDHKITATLQGRTPISQDIWITVGAENSANLDFATGAAPSVHRHHSSSPKPTPSGWDKLGSSLKKIFSPNSSPANGKKKPSH